MDFFSAQDKARARTRWLVALFVVAVLTIVVTTSGLAFFVLEHERFFPREGAAPTSALGVGQVLLEHLDVFGLIALGTVGVISAASFFKWLEVRGGGKVVAEMMGGVAVDPTTNDPFERRLLNVVEEMSIASGMPLPDVYLLPHEESINAFAAGLTTSDAVVAVTRGCLERLSRDELQGVVAHEIGHVLGGDMKLNVQLLALLHGILAFAIFGRVVIRTALYGGSRRSRNNGGVVALVAAGGALVVIGYAGYFFGRIIQAAVSRQREYLADASAVQFTRNPGGLLGALKKIGGHSLGGSMSHPRATEIGHALFAQGFRSSFVGLFATHPPLGARIRAIDPRWDGELEAVPSHDAALAEVRREASWPRAAAASQALAAGGAGAFASAIAAPAQMSYSPSRAVAEVGIVTPSGVDRARALHEAMPPALLDAAHGERSAEALVYGLLMAHGEPRLRDGQLALLARDHDADVIGALRPLLSDLRALDPALRLPLSLLTLPALRRLDAARRERFFRTLDALVHFDGHVDVFELALELVLVHHLRLAEEPTRARARLRTLPEVAREVGAVLSLLAQQAETQEGAARSFAAGAARLPTVAHLLQLVPADEGHEALLGSLGALERTSLGIRRRILDAAAHTVGGDGHISQREADLLRAIASVLDCPMPPLGLT